MLGRKFVLLLFVSLVAATNIRSFVKEGPSPVLERLLKYGDEGDKTIGQNVNTVQEVVSSNWPMGIVHYYIDLKSYDYLVSHRLRIVMNSLEMITCVRFKPLIVHPETNITWIHFTNPEHRRECFHAPNYVGNGQIVMILGLDCLKRNDILHTLLHAIGLKDEVSHPQRDQFVRILWENINPAYRHLFRIQDDVGSVKTMVEYDPVSVMHFHDRAFSWNGHATIAPLIPGLIINPSSELSELDKMKLRLLFGHECNRRGVDDLLHTCKTVLRMDPKLNNSEEKNLSEVSGEHFNKSEVEVNEDIINSDIDVNKGNNVQTNISDLDSKQMDSGDAQKLPTTTGGELLEAVSSEQVPISHKNVVTDLDATNRLGKTSNERR